MSKPEAEPIPFRPRARSAPAGRATVVATVTAVALACALAAILGPSPGGADPAIGSGGGASGDRPNVITIVTDDQDDLTFDRKLMPNLFGLLDHGGTRLENFTIVSPLCCPSRAAQLTGQYGHNNGVLANDPGFPALRDPANVLPAWMHNAGYTTAHVGRFLNGYRRATSRPAESSPGWDHWIGLMNLHYRDYDLSVEGRRTYVHGKEPRSYVTRNLHRRANRLIREMAAGPAPFYLQLDELAPHSDHIARGSCTRSALPGPQLLRPVRGIDLPANPAGESDVSDKSSYISRLPKLNRRSRTAVQQRLRCRAASIREVDRGVGRMIGLLRKLGELDNTVIVFYSDNGYFSGQHRLLKSKGLPYEESIQVPALIRVPPALLGTTAPRHSNLPLANIDLAPTTLDLAGARPCTAAGGCRVLDGRSILPALSEPTAWPRDRALGIEIDQRRSLAGGNACLQLLGGAPRRAGLCPLHTGRRARRTPMRAGRRVRALPARRRPPRALQSLSAPLAPRPVRAALAPCGERSDQSLRRQSRGVRCARSRQCLRVAAPPPPAPALRRSAELARMDRAAAQSLLGERDPLLVLGEVVDPELLEQDP